MNILSLFDGMACGMLAMLKAEIQVDNYYAYEIDKYAVQTAKHNFPNIQELGDVFNADFRQYTGIDYLIGGSPCTYWSIAQSPDKRETTASGIGWELFSQYVRALNEANPKYFIYENNKSMAKAIYNSISDTFGFEPIMINSALVSAQNRQRYYWVGKRNDDGTYSKVDVEQPEDRGILLRDVLDGYEPVNTTTDGKTNAVTTVSKDNLIGEPVCMRYERSEKAKQLRKDYESRAIKHGYHEYHELQPRADGKSNTLSTVQKDNPICVPVRCFTLPREDGAQTESKQYRVYETSGKSTTLCAEGGGMGAKTGLYAVPINKYMSKRICTMTNKQGDRIYSIDAKSICLTSSGGNFGGFSGAYAVPVEFDGDIPIKAISAADGKTYTVYEVKNGNITIKGKEYPIKLSDGLYVVRKLSVDECKRLQTVPEWYEFSYCVNQTQSFGEEVEICKNAKLRDAISLLQAEKLNYVTNIILGSCDTELRSLLESMLTTLRSVKKKGVNENAKLYKVTASSTIKSGSENNPLIQQENALFVTNRLDMQDATECVLSITINGSDTGTLCIPKKDNVSLMEILGVNTTKQLTENGFIELLQKKCSEENSQKMKLFIISTLISWIMIRTIYMFATTKPIYVCIGSWNEWRQHLLTMDLLYLKMGNIGGVSNSAAYKMLGNGWTVDVIAHLIEATKTGKTVEKIEQLSLF